MPGFFPASALPCPASARPMPRRGQSSAEHHAGITTITRLGAHAGPRNQRGGRRASRSRACGVAYGARRAQPRGRGGRPARRPDEVRLEPPRRDRRARDGRREGAVPVPAGHGVHSYRGDGQAGDRGRRRARGAHRDARGRRKRRVSRHRPADRGRRRGVGRRAHRHGPAAGGGCRARCRRRRRARAGLPLALRVHDRLPPLADPLARRGLRRAGDAPGARARAGSLAGRAAAARARRRGRRRRCAGSFPTPAPTRWCCSASAAPAA